MIKLYGFGDDRNVFKCAPLSVFQLKHSSVVQIVSNKHVFYHSGVASELYEKHIFKIIKPDVGYSSAAVNLKQF